jgi:hypothetical protein
VQWRGPFRWTGTACARPRKKALRQLFSVTWPLTGHELHRYRLTYAVTDAPGQRLRSLVVLVGNWHGVRVRVRQRTDLLRRPLRPARPMAAIQPGL